VHCFHIGHIYKFSLYSFLKFKTSCCPIYKRTITSCNKQIQESRITKMILGDGDIHFLTWQFYPTISINDLRRRGILGDAERICPSYSRRLSFSRVWEDSADMEQRIHAVVVLVRVEIGDKVDVFSFFSLVFAACISVRQEIFTA